MTTKRDHYVRDSGERKDKCGIEFPLLSDKFNATSLALTTVLNATSTQYVALERNAEIHWQSGPSKGGSKTVAELEAMAAKEPNEDWLIAIQKSDSGEVYQRHGPGMWHLVEDDDGGGDYHE